jgi:hypothetical protein
MNKDINSLLEAKASKLLAIRNTGGALTTYSASFDTKGFDGVNIALTPFDNTTGSLVAYAYDEYDDIKVTVQDSDDDAVFTDIDDIKHLPTEDADRVLSGLVKSIGAYGTKRYIRLKFVVTVLELADNKLVMDIAPVFKKLVR